MYILGMFGPGENQRSLIKKWKVNCLNRGGKAQSY